MITRIVAVSAAVALIGVAAGIALGVAHASSGVVYGVVVVLTVGGVVRALPKAVRQRGRHERQTRTVASGS